MLTPNDPVQRGCIWTGGGANICRNLLDFFDVTMDKQGRVQVGYDDGCAGSCAQSAAIADWQQLLRACCDSAAIERAQTTCGF